MSRVGNRIINIPDDVSIEINDSVVVVNGAKGTLTRKFNSEMSIRQDQGRLTVTRPSNEKAHRSLHGLTNALLANMVKGVTEGYRRSLELIGPGYRAQESGTGLTLQVGYSHPVEVTPLPGISLTLEGNNRIHVEGMDKEAVGETAARIKRIRKPNAYTGKGIRFLGENIKLKPGKAAGRKA